MQRVIRRTLVLLLTAGLALLWLAGSAQAAANRNHQECLNWCRLHPDQCDSCRKPAGCGAGWKQVKVFRGPGHNWHSCKRQDSDWQRRNLKECDQWCSQNKPLCTHCSTAPGCGPNNRSIKYFRGKGKNWYACQDRGGSESNYQACDRYCRFYSGRCVGCSTKPGCGSGQTAMKAFRGKGKNWYACQRRTRGGPLQPAR